MSFNHPGIKLEPALGPQEGATLKAEIQILESGNRIPESGIENDDRKIHFNNV